MRFNVNNHVRVKLTPFGHECLDKNYAEFGICAPKVTEDAEGWSKWQLWCLMQEFGKHMYHGGEAPFESEIELLPPTR